MGFFKDLLGLASDADWPNMQRFISCITAFYSCYLQLERDHGGKLKHEFRAYFSVMFACSAIQSPRCTLDNMPVEQWTRILSLMFSRRQDGSRFCNEPVETIALHSALILCEWKANSRAVFDELRFRNKGVFCDLTKIFLEQGKMDADYYEMYCGNRFDDFSKLDLEITGISMRCTELGIV